MISNGPAGRVICATRIFDINHSFLNPRNEVALNSDKRRLPPIWPEGLACHLAADFETNTAIAAGDEDDRPARPRPVISIIPGRF
jgi:hypothetical protein